jgi:hypothetical protein
MLELNLDTDTKTGDQKLRDRYHGLLTVKYVSARSKYAPVVGYLAGRVSQLEAGGALERNTPDTTATAVTTATTNYTGEGMAAAGVCLKTAAGNLKDGKIASYALRKKTSVVLAQCLLHSALVVVASEKDAEPTDHVDVYGLSGARKTPMTWISDPECAGIASAMTEVKPKRRNKLTSNKGIVKRDDLADSLLIAVASLVGYV